MCQVVKAGKILRLYFPLLFDIHLETRKLVLNIRYRTLVCWEVICNHVSFAVDAQNIMRISLYWKRAGQMHSYLALPTTYFSIYFLSR